LALVNRSGHTMAEQDQAPAEELAARAAVAIDNARLYAGQVSLAHRLQASLLPPSLPVVDGLDLAALYAPAGDGTEVGGDFYDCIRLSSQRLLLVVGDVKGKGVDAAVLTGTARHVIRAVANAERRPGAILTALNRVFFQEETDRISEVPRTGAASLTTSGWETASYWEATEPRFCTILAVSLPAAAGRSKPSSPAPAIRCPWFAGLTAAWGRSASLVP